MPEFNLSLTTTGFLEPAVALMLWTVVMWFWMYATRIPALKKFGGKLDPKIPNAELIAKLPYQTRWKSDNYNHLLEQPVLFYAVLFCLHLLGETNDLNTALAWLYVVLRVAHSLVQAIWNIILLRFWIFAAASFSLFGLIARAAWALWT